MVLTGLKGVATTLPLVPGIDFAGTVLEAGQQSGFKEGDKVVLTGRTMAMAMAISVDVITISIIIIRLSRPLLRPAL